jgi:AAA family ATP:ADP antiporter
MDAKGSTSSSRARPHSEAPVGTSFIERLLAPVAEVRRHEAGSALLMTLLIFLLLAAYYLLKTAREVLILTQGGAEVKSYSSAGQAILLLVLLPVYGGFASRVRPVYLVAGVTLFFTANLVLFVLAIEAGLRVGILYFLWVGIFNLMVIAQFWAFASDLYTEDEGRRLFPLIGVGGSLGAWIGSLRAGAIVEGGGPSRLLLGACVLLLVCAALVPVIHRLARRGSREAHRASDRPLAPSGGFALIRADRYLGLLALLALLLNVVNTSGEYLFGRYIVEQAHAQFGGAGAAAEAARERFVGETYSEFYSTVNLLGFLLQMFVVSRLFRWFGVAGSLFVHPLVALLGYVVMLRAPSLQTIAVLKVADNGLDYSLGNTTRQALWLPTSREAKYKAKQTVDSFFVRAGDVAQAGLVFAGERLAFTVAAFTAVNVVLAGAWLVVVGLLTTARARRVAAGSA